MITKHKQNIPALRFPGFTDEWSIQYLSTYLNFKNGINAPKESYGKGYKFINVLDIINNDFLTHELIIGSVDISENNFNKNKVEYGDILFQRSSETREEVGQSNVYLDKKIPATFGGFVIRGKKKSEYNPMFMNFLLKTSVARKDITSRSGGSTRYNIGQGSLKKVQVHFTSKEEQKKIASFLSLIDTKIEQLAKKHSLLEQYKKGMTQKLFNQQLRFKDKQRNEYPDWEEKMVGEVLKIGSGKNYKHLDVGNIPVYGTGGHMTSVNGYLYDGESVCIGRKGTIDKPMYLQGKFWTVDTLFYTHSFKSTVPRFIYSIFQTMNWKKYNEASGVPSLSKKTIEKIKIKLPSKQEQQKIADVLSAIDEKIELIATELKLAKTFKMGLLQQMFV